MILKTTVHKADKIKFNQSTERVKSSSIFLTWYIHCPKKMVWHLVKNLFSIFEFKSPCGIVLDYFRLVNFLNPQFYVKVFTQRLNVNNMSLWLKYKSFPSWMPLRIRKLLTVGSSLGQFCSVSLLSMPLTCFTFFLRFFVRFLFIVQCYSCYWWMLSDTFW